MEKTFNRRKFLKTSFLGVGSLVFSLSPLKSFAKPKQIISSNNQPVGSSINANDFYNQAKEHFYKKEYSAAENIYLQLIENFPDNIVYYDGYAKVLGAQQRSLEIAELYRIGLNINQSNPYFMNRLALKLKDLCTGNRKAEKLFVDKYGIDNLMRYSAELLLSAISIKKVKGFMLDLRDIPSIVTKRNEKLREKGYKTITFPNELTENINSVTFKVENHWLQTRTSRKEFFPKDIDSSIEKLKNKKRRNLYTNTEKKQREFSEKKARKMRWKQGLINNINNDQPVDVDKFGLLILNENINDTDTIGKMRKYYRKKNYQTRLLTLNRFLYTQDRSFINGLALATSLINYSKDNSVISECEQILHFVEPYLTTLQPVNIGSYYLIQSKINIIEGKYDIVRKNLLNGIAYFDGKGGVAYTLMEKYAFSYIGNNTNNGIAIMKALCNKSYKKNEDNIWIYVENYLQQLKVNPLSVQEQIKHLIALSKLQQKSRSSEYPQTIAEISALKA